MARNKSLEQALEKHKTNSRPSLAPRGLLAKRLLRPDEAAALLRLHKRTIYRMVADGRLPKADIPARAIRIPAESVRRMMEEDLALVEMKF